MKDKVHRVEMREDGLLIARYGADSKRSLHLCCPMCTDDDQIYPMLQSDDGVLVCMECGLAVKQKKEKPKFFVFRANGGCQHITLEKTTPPSSITGREFNVSDVAYDNTLNREELCKLCSRRYEAEYGSIDEDNLV